MTGNNFYYKVKTLIPNITQLPLNSLINELMNSIRANKNISSGAIIPIMAADSISLKKKKIA